MSHCAHQGYPMKYKSILFIFARDIHINLILGDAKSKREPKMMRNFRSKHQMYAFCVYNEKVNLMNTQWCFNCIPLRWFLHLILQLFLWSLLSPQKRCGKNQQTTHRI